MIDVPDIHGYERLPIHVKKAIAGGIEPFEILHGEILNTMIEFQDKKFKDVSWGEGYQEALTDMRVLGYNILFTVEEWKKLNGKA